MAAGARVYAGSVVDYGARAPRRDRPTGNTFQGSLGSIKDGFNLDLKELRRYMELEDAIRAGTIENGNAIIDELFPDIKALLMAPHKRLDLWAGEILSNGTVTVAASDNPQGVTFTADFGARKDKVITKVWSLAHTDHKPLTDIRKILDEQKALGRTYAKMKMSRSTFNKMVNSTEFTATYGLKLESKSLVYTVNPSNVITPAMVNLQLEAVGLPIIELVDYGVQVASGSILTPFKDDRITFHNEENFGDALYTFSNEERMPVEGVTYAKNDNVLMKYKVGEDFRLFESELNGFLVPKAISSVLIVDTATIR
jgi:hypothetical protein